MAAIGLAVEASSKRLTEIQHFLNARPEVEAWALDGKFLFIINLENDVTVGDFGDTLIDYLKKNSKDEAEIPSHLLFYLGGSGDSIAVHGWLSESVWDSFFAFTGVRRAEKPEGESAGT